MLLRYKVLTVSTHSRLKAAGFLLVALVIPN